jgi:uncharacterized protein (TIGR03000 family)
MNRNVLLKSAITCLVLLVAVDAAQAQLLGRRRARMQTPQDSGQPALVQQGIITTPGQISGDQSIYSTTQGDLTQVSAIQGGQSTDSAMLYVIMPSPNAQLTIDGQQMAPRGILRTFYSPALDRGSRYSYTIRATWNENGRPMSREQRVTVAAGRGATINLADRQASESDQSRDSIRSQQSQ